MYYGVEPVVSMSSLMHFGVSGMHWGKRKYQNKDGDVYTHKKTGTRLYSDSIMDGGFSDKDVKKAVKEVNRADARINRVNKKSDRYAKKYGFELDKSDAVGGHVYVNKNKDIVSVTDDDGNTKLIKEKMKRYSKK